MSRLFDFDPESELAYLRTRAQRFDEYATKEFWLYVFSKLVFSDRGWITSSEQPPTDYDSQRRVDIVVKRFSRGSAPVLLWAETKKGRANVTDIAAVESQGYTAGLEYLLHADPPCKAVWVMTAHGPCARLWACVHEADDGENMLQPIFPPTRDYGNKSSYLDLYGNEAAFEWMFDFIKRNHSPTPGLIAEYAAGKVPGTLVDMQSAAHVTVVQVKAGRYVECRQEDGLTMKLPATWYESYVIYDYQKLPCYHCCVDELWYWTWNLNPPLRR